MRNIPEESLRFVTTAHGVFAVTQRGSGPPVVLLHGIPLSSLTWRRNIQVLARFFSVFAIDLKGFGRSTWTSSDFSVAGHAEAVLSVFDELHIERSAVLANSYGCGPAAWLASLYPGRVQKLVLVGSVGTGTGAHHLERIVRIGAVSACIRPLLSSAVGRAVVHARLIAAYNQPPIDSRQLAAEYHRPLQERAGAIAFLESLRNLNEHAIGQCLAQLSQPALLVWGGRDRIVPVSAARCLRRRMRHATVQVFENAGHFPHEEEPDRFNAIAMQFLLNGESFPCSRIHG